MYKKGAYSVIAATFLLLAGCSNDGETKQKQSSAAQATQTVEKAASETVIGKKPEAKEEQTVAIETHGPKEETTIAQTAATVAASEPEAAKEMQSEVQKVEKKVEDASQKAAKEEIQTKVEKTEEKVQDAASDAATATLYKACAGCHGTKGEKKALGKSDVIGGWDAAKVQEALAGYKAKTRNVHGMGAVMQGQAAKLSDDEIKALGEYISKLH